MSLDDYGLPLMIVVDTESEPPRLLGTLMLPRDGDEGVVRYYDTGPDEEEHMAPEDCVRIVTVRL